MKDRRSVCFSIACALVVSTVLLNAQNKSKPPINFAAVEKWDAVSTRGITNDGKFVAFGKYALVWGKFSPEYQVMVVQSITGAWKIELPGVFNIGFTDDSRRVVYMKSDTLCIQTLGSSSVECTPDVASFRLFMSGSKEALAFQSKGKDARLVIRDLSSGKSRSFQGIKDYSLSKDGTKLVFRSEAKEGNKAQQTMSWVDLENDRSRVIWSGSNASSIVMDGVGDQVAFIVRDTVNGEPETSLLLYGAKTRKVETVVNTSAGESGMTISAIQQFSKDGQRLLLALKELRPAKPSANAVQVDAWSYMDVQLQSQQLQSLATQSYMAVVNVDDHRLLRLQENNEEFQLLDRDEWAVVTRTDGGDEIELGWNKASVPSFYLVSTKTGERKELAFNYPHLTLGGKYLGGNDSKIRHVHNDLLLMNLATGRTLNLTESLPVPTDEKSVFGWNTIRHRGLMGTGAWIGNDEGMLVYDKYDIWELDPSGKKPPFSVTNGFGRRNNITFRFFPLFPSRVIAKDERVLLKAFDNKTKKEGFYWTSLNANEDPKVILMEDASLEIAAKARDEEVYLVSRGSASQTPNLFWTTDFKTFHQLTQVYPEKAYNWLTTELIEFKTLDGQTSQGILYKPENFDPRVKYPMIFHYYEELSDDLNNYKLPGIFWDRINIPWLVSNGYLVFEPDIIFTVGETGQSATRAVVGAAKHMARFPWVDSKRMGITGHSFGGYETNCIVTQTDVFAAAVAAMGKTNVVSAYGLVMDNGAPFNRHWLEFGQARMGATLWEKPDRYIANSPVFHADKVTTPLLMVNNKEDGIIQFSQGVEFFTALRRLGKRVWMLQYDGENHSMLNTAAQKDYTMRVVQFFDHYLKGGPAPRWMTRGIPASMKGVDDGLELDHEIKTPGPGLLKTEKTTKETNRN